MASDPLEDRRCLACGGPAVASMLMILIRHNTEGRSVMKRWICVCADCLNPQAGAAAEGYRKLKASLGCLAFGLYNDAGSK